MEIRVREVRVEASSKHWAVTSPFGSGSSTSLALTIAPPAGSTWSVEESRLAIMKVRVDIEAMLLTDARIRGQIIPENAAEIISNYQSYVRTLEVGKEVKGEA